MSGLLALFVAPVPAAAPVEAPAPRAAAQLAGVLAPPGCLAPAAGAVAARLRRLAGARTAVVCEPAARPSAPALPAAARLARRLAGRDVAAVAAGALCHVELPADPDGAIVALWRVVEAVEVPVVLALSARVDGFDGALSQADRLVVAAPADADAAVLDLAVESLSRLGPPVDRLLAPASAVAARLAALGVAPAALPATAEAHA
jgi:hypothetical protein